MLRTLILSLMLIVTTAFAGARSDMDANADHNILTPTAETMNKGELTFNSYELVLAGISYGVTDEFQLTFTTLLPLVKNMPFVGLFTGKYKVMDSGTSAFSIQPGLLFMAYEGETVGTVNFTAMFDIMLNNDNIVTFSSAVNVPFAENDMMDGFLMTFTAAINSKMSNHVKIIAELTMAGAYAEGSFHMSDDVMLFNYGVRFFNKDLAAMLSFLRPIVMSGDNPFLMGYPYVTFTAKF